MLSYSSPFPPQFVWGVATAAPQIEGGAFEGGKGASVWDHFSRLPGKVHNGDTLDVACDHYHRFGEDFALMRSLGIRNYRLSIAWPRIFPQGAGTVNAEGIAFYNRLFDAMLANGITPWVTMFHWDLPQALDERGGWAWRGTADAFGAYADTIVKAFGDRVKNWITLNEIRCFTFLAHDLTLKAPGRKLTRAELNQTYHHALLCHGHGVRAVRTYGGVGARVGLTDNCDVCVPVTEKPADIEAARAWFTQRNAHILGAIYAGEYSKAYLERCGADRPKVEPSDFELISLPTDFLGLNIYSGTYVRAHATTGLPEEVTFPANYPRADSPWLNLMPQCIYWGPRLVQELYGVSSIYITENGCGYNEEPVIDGEVRDLHRRDFVRNYLRELHRAVSDGVPVRGYFLWSFMDNYEWEDGYQRRFGIVHVDFATQKRTPKLSARYYADVIEQNRIL